MSRSLRKQPSKNAYHIRVLYIIDLFLAIQRTGGKNIDILGDIYLLKRYFYYFSPNLNSQSCNRRPLCSTFTFKNVSSPKKTQFYSQKIKNNNNNNLSCNFLVRTL